MKIGITCYPTYGGSGIVATELGMELADRGHEIHFISYALPMRLNRLQPSIYFHEVEVPAYPLFDHPPYTLVLATKMAEVAESHGLDLLHCHYAIPHSVSAFLAKSMIHPRKLPVVTTLHGTDITLVGSDRSYLPITRFSIDQSDGVTAVSHFLKEATLRVIGASKDIEVIYNFVNCDKYRPLQNEPLRSHFAPDKEKILIHISNFRAVKRPTDVVEIFHQVQEKMPAILLMVGDGPNEATRSGPQKAGGSIRKYTSSASAKTSRNFFRFLTCFCFQAKPNLSDSWPWKRWRARFPSSPPRLEACLK